MSLTWPGSWPSATPTCPWLWRVGSRAGHATAGLHPKLHTTDVLWRMVWETVDLPVDEAAARIDGLIRNLGSPLYDFGLLAIRRATRVHAIGGGHIRVTGPPRPAVAGGPDARRAGDATVAATGLGMVPSPEPRFVRDMLGQFGHASVRDQGTGDFSGVPVAPDDAFLGLPSLPAFDARPTASTPGEQGDVWVCLQRDLASEGAFEANVEAVRTILTSGLVEGRTVRYLEAIPGGDHSAFERLSDLIPADNFVPFVRLWSEPFPARPRQVWLTSRFHLHLLAAASGAAGVALEIDDDYYKAKHASLIEAGTGMVAVQRTRRRGALAFRRPRLPRRRATDAPGQGPRGRAALPLARPGPTGRGTTPSERALDPPTKGDDT